MMQEPLFKAPWWARNRHLQTLLPTYLLAKKTLKLHWQEFPIDDDFVDLAWYPAKPKATYRGPLVVIFHGLEGSAHSPYAKYLMEAFAQQGWPVVLMHFRGCSGRPNKQWRGYHSGEIGDAQALIKALSHDYPQASLVAVGISLGGNMLANYLSHTPETALKAAALISPPLHLAACSEAITQGFSKLYQRHLIARMKRNLARKIEQTENSPLTVDQVHTWHNFKDFDQHYTAPAHGFSGADDYYAQCSALGKLSNIARPCLLIHAKDDPFMDTRVIPRKEQLSPFIDYRLSQTGGHVGFVEGSLFKPRYYLAQLLPQWFQQQLNNEV